MGKKTKIGKHRKDKYYKLAKESGFRSRAAFKLIQLNRRYEFLQRSRVLVDLCAAPGGWLQVAAKYMPVSSIIIGIDLVPIKQMADVVTVQEDITTDRCRTFLKRQLQTWKVDVFLNDGAPNVGQNWLHDAFAQARLTLSALKLATQFLNKGGWFITKVFRSKDYNALMSVFSQLFKWVAATKPQASRLESAEIFVVCKGFKAPAHIDPKLLDPKCVFAEEEVEEEKVNKTLLFHPEKQKKKKAVGYKDGDYTLYHTNKISDFVRTDRYAEILDDCNELVFDDAEIAEHKLTTKEILECCKDLKVLGRKDLRLLLNWRKALRKELMPESEKKEEVEKVDSDEELDKKIEAELVAINKDRLHTDKKKKRKMLKERKKLHDKVNLKMVIDDDNPVTMQDESLFRLAQIRTDMELNEVKDGNIEQAGEDMSDSENKRETPAKFRLYDPSKPAQYDAIDDVHVTSSDESEYENEGYEEIELSETEDDDDDKVEGEGDENPLIVDTFDQDTRDGRQKRRTKEWFAKDIFDGLETEKDEDLELELAVRTQKSQENVQKKIVEPKVSSENDTVATSDDNVTKLPESSDSSDSDSSDSEYDESELYGEGGGAILNNATEDGFEIVPITQTKKTKKQKRWLNPEEMALGAIMIKSKKTKRDIMDDAWSRYMYDDDNLPEWFVKDEHQHNKKQLPVTKEMVQEYKERLKEINARPIKKVAEAKARKKRKAERISEKARKRAETVSDNIDMTDKEKLSQIKAIYKKAGMVGKKKVEVSYVVAKRHTQSGRRASRPAGVKGRYKVVDPRMKKDNRTEKHAAKQAAKNKSRKKSGKNKSKARGKASKSK